MLAYLLSKIVYSPFLSVISFCSLYDDILDVRFHFDASEMFELKLCSSDVTYLNMIAVMENPRI